ncbi:fructosamine kinase family protein [Actinophytocola gossypii]|uniref:Fructosamine kinase family protein n=1 Tax=Actinophytocola gossypii TaxID=2812003 RepID=A0ABT2JHJ5_9PSEU|nr:fructosamine kinase family protein [Actinophytocola gossypii]
MRGAEAATALTGVRAVSSAALGGTAHRIELADGSVVVAKRHDHASAVLAEATGLRWLADAGSVPVPAVRGHDDEWLVADHVTPGSPTATGAEALGRDLAGLHAAGAPAFGAPPPDGPVDAWIGLAPMRNETGADWPSWYAAHRLEPYLRTAADHGHDLRVVGEVCERVDALAGPAEPPARLHGDLWSGNVLWSTGGAWLIDPAAHGGHRETDLAMLHLFGCAHLDRVVAGYEEVAPLADGWRARIPLHQLFPLLVHTVLFGGGYARQTRDAARAALRA